jgi:alpha-1,3-glucosyltransferase
VFSEYRQWSFVRFFTLGGLVIMVFALSFGPFVLMGQMGNVLSRLFPFKRGLSHAYWAPNFWALYNFGDKILTSAFSRLRKNASMTRGLVGDVEHVVLPTIKPIVTLVSTVLTMLPVLGSVFKDPYPKTFLPALNYVMMCSFMLGWHVHEKAILMLTIPLGLQALSSKFYLDFYTFIAMTGHFSLFPLLFTPHGNVLISFSSR